MLKEPTVEKLRALRLDALADAWLAQQQQPDLAKLGFDERLAMLVDAEWLYRENKRLERALKEAKLKLGSACIEDIDYAARRELDRAVVRQLATCRWVAGIRTSSSPAPPAQARATSRARSRSKPAARGTGPSTDAHHD